MDVDQPANDSQDGDASGDKQSDTARPSTQNAATISEADALTEHDLQKLHLLRLQRKFYAEGLSFVRQLEAATTTICKLLGSTSKAEVLEAIEFFRVAKEYQLDGAEVIISICSYLVKLTNYRPVSGK
jgi:condensin complex subunit 1